MHITGMKIEGIPPFTDKVEFEFDKRVNVFIGPNAVGKTAALLGLSQIPSGPPYGIINYVGEVGWQELSVSPDWPMVSEEQSNHEDDQHPAPKWDEAPFVYVGATRLNLPEQADLFGDIGEIVPVDPRIVRQFIFEPVVATGSGGRTNTFDASVVESAIGGWAWQPSDTVGESDSDPAFAMRQEYFRKQQFDTAIELGLRCAHSICNEIITSNRPRNFVKPGEGDMISNLRATTPEIQRGMGIMTVDNAIWSNPDPLYAGNLSAGSQGTLMWVWLLALKMVHHYGYRTDWDQRPAILLIDEIENHLHPTWQRRVIPALLDHFPGLQIFATTHSPFVVAGLKKGQVHLLKRDENGVVTASANTENIEGWTADEILRVYMGVDEPTDELTAQAARELRRLRAQPPVMDEWEEEERQAEIRRLRQIVDRAELSGPRAAEDARFLADLRSILHRYSQSQNLNQENG
ncbi:MAG: AAA family ATPase [Chloroflexota bacterium]|nr:AAA family ATPase [Chloroflexota bacterium]MDE2959964.1 AAA family ATPase [Chloroflexota bacterium]